MKRTLVPAALCLAMLLAAESVSSAQTGTKPSDKPPPRRPPAAATECP
jgi:hypothetical protein